MDTDSDRPSSFIAAVENIRSKFNLRLESLAALKLEIYFHAEKLGDATGFVYRFADEYVLVTNWHVLSGRNPLTGVTLDKRGYYPTKVSTYLNVASDLHTFDIQSVDIELYDEDGKGRWIEHTAETPVADVAMIKLGEVIESFADMAFAVMHIPGGRVLVRGETFDDMKAYHAYPRVGADVFILGFPMGIGQGTLPVWKRGSIASEPLYGVVNDGAPIIFIDALTRKGMSGAPVVFFGEEVAGDLGSGSTGGSIQPWLVGVYAGRDGSSQDELTMTLGRVWKIEIVHDLFFEKTSRKPLKPS